MLTQEVCNYLRRLVERYPSVSEIWLIGSRANGRWRPESDWDFLVFADNDAFQAMKRDPSLDCRGIDVLVVYDGDSFEQPWGDTPKRGSLERWQWSRVSGRNATYVQTKWTSNDESIERSPNAEGPAEFGYWTDTRAEGILIWSNSRGDFEGLPSN